MTPPADAPAVPRGWENASARLLRLVDASGDAVAWMAPDLGANCVGYAVRRPNGIWIHVLHAPSEHAVMARPTLFGCPILFPFPGYTRNARYTWDGVRYALPINAPMGTDHVHGFAHSHPWQPERAGPAAVVARLSTQTALTRDERAGYPFDVQLRVMARLDTLALVLELEATNMGKRMAPMGLGLHPYFTPGTCGGDREDMRVQLPGRSQRNLAGPFPTGENVAVRSPDIAVPAVGQALLVARTDLADRPVVRLTLPDASQTVAIELSGAVRDLLLWAPADQPSVALEPLTCALSAASQPQGHPDGLPGFAPGERSSIAMRIMVEVR